MNARTIISSLLAASLALGLVACQQRDTSPFAGRADPTPSPGNNPRIITSTPDLTAALGFDQPIVSRESDILTVAVPMRSLGDQRYRLDYRFVFYDARGMEIAPVMGWREVTLEPREQRRVQANAIDSTAQDWRMQVKWANQ